MIEWRKTSEEMNYRGMGSAESSSEGWQGARSLLIAESLASRGKEKSWCSQSPVRVAAMGRVSPNRKDLWNMEDAPMARTVIQSGEEGDQKQPQSLSPLPSSNLLLVLLWAEPDLKPPGKEVLVIESMEFSFSARMDWGVRGREEWKITREGDLLR